MKYLKLIFLFTTINNFVALSQEIFNDNYLNEIMPNNNLFSTPDVKAFHRINSLPVNLYTGKIAINIPLYEIKSGNITLPISLSYDAGGIKIDDKASSVGMGWALNAGGSIIRIIKDIEDFNYTTIQRKIPNYIKRELASNGRLCDMISLFEGKSRDYRSDASPDIFIINGNNLNNKFYIEKDVTNRYIPQVIDGSKLIIETECKKQILDSEILNNVGFDIKDINKYHSEQIQFKSLASKTSDYTFFNVTNTDGLKYFFEDKDLGENIPMHTNTIMQELM